MLSMAAVVFTWPTKQLGASSGLNEMCLRPFAVYCPLRFED